MRWFWLTSALLLGCSSTLEVEIDRPWAADQPLVLILSNAEDVLTSAFAPPQPVQNVELRVPGDATALYARTLPQLLEYEPLGDCNVSVRDEAGELISSIGEAWKAENLAEGAPLAFEREDVPRPFVLHVSGCAPKKPSCDVQIELLTAPVQEGSLTGVAALPDGRVLAGGLGSVADPRSSFLLYDGTTFRMFGPYDALFGTISGLGLLADRITGATNTLLFELDLAGRLLRTATVGFTISDLTVGADGSVGLIGGLGEIAIQRAGSRQIEALAPPDYAALGIDIPEIALRSADSVLIMGPDGRIYVYEEQRWERVLANIDAFDEVAADADNLLVVPQEAGLHMRRKGESNWTAVSDGLLINAMTSAIPLGKGRFLIAGQSGGLHYWNGVELCNPATASAQNIEGLGFDPTTQTAYAVGQASAPGGAPLMMRIRIPR